MAFSIRNFTQVLRVGGILFRGPRTLGMRVINKTGSSIAANKLVAISGYDVTSKKPKVVLADADVVGHMDVYVTKAAIANGAVGDVFKGFLSPATLDTSGVTTVGDAVYLSATAGAFTATAPTAANARQQVVGYAQVKSSTVGQVTFDIQPPQKLGSNELNGLGFVTGVGGAVTQGSGRTTGVVLSTLCGAITTDNASLAAAGEAEFTVTNTLVAATDVVVVCLKTESTTGTSVPYVSTVADGSFKITLSNLHATTADTSVSVINFVVIKAVAA